MDKAFDLSSIRLKLRDGIEKGYWTIDDLDNPPPGYKMFVEELANHRLPSYRRIPIQAPYKNLLRDDPAQSVSPTLPSTQESQTNLRRSDSYVSSLGDGVDVVLGVTSDQPQNSSTDADNSEYAF